MNLESGVQVQFTAGSFRTGDYWLFPARAGIGVLWALDAKNNAVFRSPQGITHRYCRLAILDFQSDTWSVIADCRTLFPALSELSAVTAEAFHVQHVLLADAPVPLRNDSTLEPERLLNGIIVECDRAVDPVSVSSATCEVTIWLPHPLGAPPWKPTDIFGTMPLVVDASVTVLEGTRIIWRPSVLAASWLSREFRDVLARFPPPRKILARLRLRGGFIWAHDNPEVHLDGTSFGKPRVEGGTDIVLRSGDGRRAGDFSMWFWLTPQATGSP